MVRLLGTSQQQALQEYVLVKKHTMAAEDCFTHLTQKKGDVIDAK